MSNCLSAIQHLIKSGNSYKATSYVAKFGMMVRQILDFSSKPVIALNEELELLKIYLDLEQLRFENKFSYEIILEENVIVSQTWVPPLILNPLVENAIWHGLLPVRDIRQGHLRIIIRHKNDCLILIMEDNGAGRDPAKEKSLTGKNSYGISITTQRLANINYLYQRKEAHLEFEDLKDEAGKPIGTRASIYLPSNLTLQRNE